MEVANRVIKNTFFLYTKMIITVFSSLYTTRLILHALGVNDFGIFNLVAGMISMLVFLNVAMAKASQRFMSYYHTSTDSLAQKKIFNISLILHLMIGLILIFFLEIAGYFLFQYVLQIDLERIEIAKIIFHFAVVSTFFTVISVPFDAVINSNENMFFVSILGIFESLLKLIIALFITNYQADKLLIYGLLMLLIVILNFVIKFAYSYKKYSEVEINILKYFDKDIYKEMLSFASYTLIGTFSSIINNYGQAPLLNMFFGTVVNAAQGIVSQISGQLGALAITMLTALNPVIDKSEGAGNRDLMIKVSFTGAKFALFLLLLFYIPLFFEIDTILKFWLVEIPSFTLIFCKLLLIRNFIEQSYTTISSSIAATGNIKKYQIYSSMLTFFPLIISYYLFKIGYEPFILYIINIIYSLINGALILYFAKKECGISILSYFKIVLSRVFISLILISSVVFIFYYFFHESNYRWIVTFLSSFIAFLIVIYNIGLNKEERNFLIKFVNKRRQKND